MFCFIVLCIFFTLESTDVYMHKHNAKFSGMMSNITAVDSLLKTLAAYILLKLSGANVH